MKQKGFTLIELVVVIVILGILAAVAMPKFIDLKADAEQAAADGVAGGIASSASLTFAHSKVSTGVTYSAGAACGGSYLESGLPSTCTTSGDVSCTVTCGGGTKTVALPS